ncbi:MAG: APC family permease [Candidatus Eisenbacteria bacterium]|nr:APC family permease [Candidatus Eisenbacteria bacterium]
MESNNARPVFVQARRPLQQVLGVWSGAAVGIGVAIGAGIFRTPGYVASFLPSDWIILGVWLLGGLLVIGDALVLSELATRYPRAGGWYVYIEKGWGRFPAFAYGWAFSLIVDPASSAALVVILGEYLAPGLKLSATGGRLAAIALTLGLFGLSWLGVRVGARMQQLLTWTKLVILLGVSLMAFWLPAISSGDIPAGAAVVAGAFSGSGWLAPLLAIGLALQGVLWTFEGYANTTTLTEEAKDARRVLPRSLIGGAVVLTVVYLLVNAAYLHVLGRDGLAAANLPGSDILGRLAGAGGYTLFLVVAIVAAIGSLNGAVLTAPRVLYALARSGLAPEPLTRVNRAGTPDLATLWFAVTWTAYAWFGTLEALIAVSIFIGALANIMVTAGLFRIRRREGLLAPDGSRPFLCPAWPVLPGVLLLLWTSLAAANLKSQGWQVGYGLLLVLLAAPFYLIVRRRAAGARPIRL